VGASRQRNYREARAIVTKSIAVASGTVSTRGESPHPSPPPQEREREQTAHRGSNTAPISSNSPRTYPAKNRPEAMRGRWATGQL
jgi:hypothetical protein